MPKNQAVNFFTKKIDSLSPGHIAREIKEKGYVVLENALTAECVQLINEETANLGYKINNNWPGPVIFKNQRYLTHCLANSKTIFDLMTTGFCFEVMKSYFKDRFRLTDQRVYV